MARKSVIVEPEYDGKGDKSTIIYYDLIIPVILHGSVGGSKVSLSEKIPHKGHLNLTREFREFRSPGVQGVQEFSTVPDVTHSKTS